MPVAIAVAGLVVAAAGTAASVVSGNQARAQSRHTADLQQQAQDATTAQNRQEQLEAQRQQIREARVRQARIENSAVNAGSNGSSGALGADSAIATNLSNNLGIQQGRVATADTLSNLGQLAANSNSDMQSDLAGVQLGQAFTSLGSNLFSTGTRSLTKPATNRTV